MADANVAENGSAKSKKPRLVENYYVNEAGERASRPQPDVVKIGKKFLESGHEEEIVLADLPQAQLLQSAAFGLQQVGQNAYGAAGDENERIDMLNDRWATIKGGSWADTAQRGPSTSDVVEAWFAAKEEHTGRKSTEEEKSALRKRLDAEEISSKTMLENPKVAAKYHAIKAQRAAERAKKSAEKAEGAEEVSFDL
jgi:hypothetical protein